MTRRLGTLITIALAAAATSLLATPSIANAHGVVDQAWEGPPSCQETKSTTIQGQVSLGMEFTPSHSSLVAVDLSVIQANEAGDATITVQLRDATISGSVLASVSQQVPESISRDAMNPSFVHFDFPSVISVVPGQTYVIEFTSSNTTHAVNGCEGSGETGEYPGGDSVVGVQHHDVDFFFRTYREGEPAPATPVATATAIAPRATETPAVRPAPQGTPTWLPVLPRVGQGGYPAPGGTRWPVATLAAAVVLSSAAWCARRRLRG